MSKLTAAVCRFPDRELEIYRLCARSLEFRAVCEDLGVAVAALAHWRSAGGKAAGRSAEYEVIADELASEILAALDAERCTRRPFDH